MVITQRRTAVLVSELMLRGAIVSLLAACVVAMTPAEAVAQGRRARLSEDLVERLRNGDTTDTSVIVTGTQATVNALAARHGLRVRKRLQSGAVLDVPAGALALVADDPDAGSLSPNATLRAQGSISSDSGVPHWVISTGAEQVQEAGWTGEGVGVAVIDSGMANVPELRNRIVVSRDFTDVRGTGLDRYGHGTHMAGTIAAASLKKGSSSPGMAPSAHLINLKVLDAHGIGHADDVIEAIDWAVANAKRYRIRIINLSLGGPVVQSWRDEPLCHAVERAFLARITVIASAGNWGQTVDGKEVFGGISVPGNCPHSITVGGLNTKGTPFRSDDELSARSSRGPTHIGSCQRH